MSTKNSIKINSELGIFFVVLVVLFGIIGLTAINIFDAFNLSRSVNPDLLKSTDVRVSEKDLLKAITAGYDDSLMPLDLPE